MTLINRIEQAGEGEERELLHAYAQNLWGWFEVRDGTDPDAYVKRWVKFNRMLDAEAYLSAAEMLVPEGAEWNAGRFSDGTGVSSLWIGDMHEFTGDGAATPALALLSAILKAGERG